MTLEKPVSKQSSMEIEEVSRLLDHESFQILQELQEALDGVDLEGKREAHHAKKNLTVREDDEDDPESEEHELCLLMDSLVAELRADLQSETVQEVARTKNEIYVPTEGPVVPNSNTLDVPVSDFTNHPGVHRLTDAQKELLQRLRIHLSHREPYKRKPEEDRVHQEIPDLEFSNDDDEVNWEPIPTIAKEDPDFVPVSDFTPTKHQRRELAVHPKNPNTIRQSTQTNAEQLEKYFRARSREEQFVEKWADHDIWKQICRILFPPDQLGGTNIPAHRTRLVE